MVPESIGKRIAQLRQQRGWTQEALASRIAISRVAVSHIELDLSIPSERTIALVAGLFKITPFALVEGTTYPRGKADRLPESVCCYTEIELELALLHNDLAWLHQLVDSDQWRDLAAAVRAKWLPRLGALRASVTRPHEKDIIAEARLDLRTACGRELPLAEVEPLSP